MKSKLSKRPKRDWFASVILHAKPEMTRLLDREDPDWSKDFKLMRAEFLTSPKLKNAVILRCWIAPRRSLLAPTKRKR